MMIQDKMLETRILGLSDAHLQSGTTLIEPISIVRRTHPAFVLDLSGESLPHHLFHEDPMEVGGILRSEWDDATLFGWDAFQVFINASGDLTTQDIAGTASRVDRYLQRPPAPPYRTPSLTRDDRTVKVDFTGISHEAIRSCPGGIYFGTPIEPLNWGMWLLHCIPSASDYLSMGHNGLFGCWFKLEWQHKILNFMGIPDEKLFQIDEWKVHVTERLTFRSYPKIDLYVGQQDKLIFSAIAQRGIRHSLVRSPPRLFISRLSRSTSGSGRQLANEAEFAEALKAIGFVVVEPETLPFEDQVALFASASVIVGLGGAGMFNVVFSKPGTKVVTIESSNAFIHNHANLFASLGLEYAVVFGERDRLDNAWPHHRWFIDIPSAVKCIEEFV